MTLHGPVKAIIFCYAWFFLFFISNVTERNSIVEPLPYVRKCMGGDNESVTATHPPVSLHISKVDTID